MPKITMVQPETGYLARDTKTDADADATDNSREPETQFDHL